MGKSHIAAPLPRVKLDFIIIIWDLLIPFRISEFLDFPFLFWAGTSVL